MAFLELQAMKRPGGHGGNKTSNLSLLACDSHGSNLSALVCG